jgi:hypothetical protein
MSLRDEYALMPQAKKDAARERVAKMRAMLMAGK